MKEAFIDLLRTVQPKVGDLEMWEVEWWVEHQDSKARLQCVITETRLNKVTVKCGKQNGPEMSDEYHRLVTDLLRDLSYTEGTQIALTAEGVRLLRVYEEELVKLEAIDNTE